MASVSYTAFDGEDRTVRLTVNQPVRIGREPSNDVVLRDPKASRAHAQIVFERGFFVVHDMDSANGTWVDGQRVRVAPLRDGAEIRIGNTLLRFSEELEVPGEGDGPTTVAPLRGGLPRERDLPPTEVASVRAAEDEGPFEQEADRASGPAPVGRPEPPPSSGNGSARAIARPVAPLEPMVNPAPATMSVPDEPTRAIPASQLPVVSPAATRPISMPPPSVEPDKKTTQRQSVPPMPPTVARTPDALRTPVSRDVGTDPMPASPGPTHKSGVESLRLLTNRQFLIDDFEPGPEEAAIRNEIDQPLVWFRSPRSATALIAGFVATMIIIAGLAVLPFLLYERAWSAAVAAVLITVAFAAMVGAAIPRRYIPMWHTAPPATPAITIAQEPGLPLPQLRFAVMGASGAILGVTSKQVFPSIGRRVWRLLDAAGDTEIARATEDSLIRSLIGRVIGGSIRVLRTNYVITRDGRTIGTLDRARGRPGRLMLDLSSDDGSTDRALLLALALTIVSVER